MTFLQPILLWLLPLALLPVVIHLLNRMRFQTVDWAAMRFLMRSGRESNRWERIRQWLILALRVLLLLALLLALARPLVGGWLGWAFRAAPEVIVILLDRSASMERRSGAQGVSLRLAAVEALVEAASRLDRKSRLVVFDPVRSEFRELADAELLRASNAAAASDAAVSLPESIRILASWMREHKTGRAEIWIASDLQGSSWDADSATWKQVAAELRGLETAPRIRILGLVAERQDDFAIRVPWAKKTPNGSTLEFEWELQAPGGDTRVETVEAVLDLDGLRSSVRLDPEGIITRQVHEVETGRESGWGVIELAPDANPANNHAYFVYETAAPPAAALYAENAEAAVALRLAALPADPGQVTDLDMSRLAEGMENVSVLIWQGKLPTEEAAARISEWIERGGTALFLPPAQGDGGSFLGVGMGAGEENTLGITRWDRQQGIFADTREGYSLPLDRLLVVRRSLLSGRATHLASFEDHQPVFAAVNHGKGLAVFAATLPVPEWSTLAEGRVLVPAMQRLLQRARGLEKRADMPVGSAGRAASAAGWEPVLNTLAGKNPQEHAGLFRDGTTIIATNRPASEDEAALIDESTALALFEGLDATVFRSEGRADRALQSEFFTTLLLLALGFLAFEGWLLLPKKEQVAGRGDLPDRRKKPATVST